MQAYSAQLYTGRGLCLSKGYLQSVITYYYYQFTAGFGQFMPIDIRGVHMVTNLS